MAKNKLAMATTEKPYSIVEVQRDLALVRTKGRGWSLALARLQKHQSIASDSYHRLSHTDEQKCEELGLYISPATTTSVKTGKTVDQSFDPTF